MCDLKLVWAKKKNQPKNQNLDNIGYQILAKSHCNYSVCLGDTAVLHRGTPLYGQPAWWGDEDADRSEENRSERKREKVETGMR